MGKIKSTFKLREMTLHLNTSICEMSNVQHELEIKILSPNKIIAHISEACVQE